MNAQSSTRNRAPLSASALLRHQQEVHTNRRVAQLASTVHRRVPCVEVDTFLHGWRELGQVLDDQPSRREVEHGFYLISWVVIAKVGSRTAILSSFAAAGVIIISICIVEFWPVNPTAVRYVLGRDFLFQTNTPTRVFGQ